MNLMIVDIGSNTIKYDIFSPDCPISIGHRSIAAGIIRYIENGVLNAKGIDVLSEILTSYKEDAIKLGTSMHVFATASLRRVAEPQVVIDEIKKRTDIEIDLISGQRESSLSLLGMLATTDHPSKGLMMDMGGGSTELNSFENDASLFSVSCPFGALSLKNEFVSDVFPTEEEAVDIKNYAKNVFSEYKNEIQTDILYMVGGSAKAIAKLLRYKVPLPKTELAKPFEAERMHQLLKDCIPCNLEDQNLLKELFPDRYHVMLPALCAYISLLEVCGTKQVCVSAGGIREGYWLELIKNDEVNQ